MTCYGRGAQNDSQSSLEPPHPQPFSPGVPGEKGAKLELTASLQNSVSPRPGTPGRGAGGEGAAEGKAQPPADRKNGMKSPRKRVRLMAFGTTRKPHDSFQHDSIRSGTQRESVRATSAATFAGYSPASATRPISPKTPRNSFSNKSRFLRKRNRVILSLVFYDSAAMRNVPTFDRRRWPASALKLAARSVIVFACPYTCKWHEWVPLRAFGAPVL
jgi:hypothetical protein